MATWRAEFERLSAEHGEQMDKWNEGQNYNQALRNSTEAMADFLRRYESTGRPDRDQEMPS